MKTNKINTFFCFHPSIADKIIAFQYYCIENKNFARLFTTGNRSEILFCMLQLAITFNELQIHVIKS